MFLLIWDHRYVVIILLFLFIVAQASDQMSDQEQFQSADKQCQLEIVNGFRTYGHSLSPRKKVKENNLQWKFEKIKRIMPTTISPRKHQARNISFQTEDLGELSDNESCESDQRVSVFKNLYKNCKQVYKKQKALGTNWLGHRQYFASVFVDPLKLANYDLKLFKQTPLKTPSIPNICEFDSNFQSGNLFAVYQIQKNEYDLVLQNDVNSKGNTQWFYFQISNMPAKTKTKINIVNMLKGDSLFNYGMQPCLHSTEAEKKNGQGWFRAGTHIKYFKNQNRVDGSNRCYYTLTFTISTSYEGDVLRIAQCYPYTVSDLNKYLESVEKKPGRKALMRRQSAGQTVGKNNIEVLRVMEENPRKKTPRSLIVVTARQHPGETPGSLVCQGFMDFILSEDKEAQYLRKNYEIVVLPMLNPDGVIVGNYRTNLSGLDLNRRWDGSKPKEALQSVLVKRYIIQISRNREISFIVDLHGHSRKLFSFFYGNTGLQTAEQVRIYPYICSKLSENMIRFQDSTFMCEEAKRRTARIQMFSKFKIANIFTFETSFFGFYNKNREKVHFTEQKFMALGCILGRSMFMHERHKNNPQSVQSLLVKKYFDELRNKPELIACGEKVGSGSESDPEKGQIKQIQYSKLQNDDEFSKQFENRNKSPKKHSKKDIIIKDIPKQSRQLHVMDIARVNSIFPNDILALMPSSMGRKVDKEKVRVDRASVLSQTEDMPLIKIYDICKFQQLAAVQKRQENIKRKIAIKNQSDVPTVSKSNLFRTIIRPKSSSNSYLELNMKNTPGKKQIRKRHESGYEMKGRLDRKNGISVYSQTAISFPPSTDFMAQTLDNLVISPASKGLENLRNRSKFASMNPTSDPLPSQSKRSSQSFKIGLRALNVETWRIKKKNFQ